MFQETFAQHFHVLVRRSSLIQYLRRTRTLKIQSRSRRVRPRPFFTSSSLRSVLLVFRNKYCSGLSTTRLHNIQFNWLLFSLPPIVAIQLDVLVFAFGRLRPGQRRFPYRWQISTQLPFLQFFGPLSSIIRILSRSFSKENRPIHCASGLHSDRRVPHYYTDSSTPLEGFDPALITQAQPSPLHSLL